VYTNGIVQTSMISRTVAGVTISAARSIGNVNRITYNPPTDRPATVREIIEV